MSKDVLIIIAIFSFLLLSFAFFKLYNTVTAYSYLEEHKKSFYRSEYYQMRGELQAQIGGYAVLFAITFIALYVCLKSVTKTETEIRETSKTRKEIEDEIIKEAIEDAEKNE